MPRRPSSAKRGAKGGSKPKPRGVNRKDARIKKWDKREDIPLDEEDEFDASRDEILLEGGREDSDDGEDEVFVLRGMSESDGDSEDEDEQDAGSEDAEDDHAPSTSTSIKPRNTKKKPTAPSPSSSSASDESDSEEETWGHTKAAYYASNDAALESDDEEAHALEAAEARRLQAKARAAMTEEDFGLADELGGVELEDVQEQEPLSVETRVPEDRPGRLRLLERTSPETLALARDWPLTAHALARARAKLQTLEETAPDALALGMVHLHYQALLTYTTTLAFYLRLRASPTYASKPGLLNAHPVMARLLSLKSALGTLEELDFAPSDSDEEEGEEGEHGFRVGMGGMDGEEEDEDEDDVMVDAEGLWRLARKEGLEADELAELLRDAQAAADADPRPKRRHGDDAAQPAKKRKTASSLASVPKTEKKAKKTKSPHPPTPAFDLAEPDFAALSAPAPTPSRLTRAAEDADADDTAYGEPASLAPADRADKSARRRTLRFHTARIEGAARKRAGAAVGGDDDVPYRERRRERAAREEREAEKRRERGEVGVGGEVLEVDGEGEGEGEAGEDESEDGYYELVKKTKRKEKERKKEEYEGARAAERAALSDQLTDGASGPRATTRAILANKGLTPHRPKTVRNPRVKKRRAFEKAERKVRSQRAVYKGGEGREREGYGGERSGISKVVKSVRLG